MKTTAKQSPAAAAAAGTVALLVATRKGAFILKADKGRRKWNISGPMFFGHVVHHLVLDPRDRRTLLAAARTGHLGPTVFRSGDFGRNWKEAAKPPAFPKAPAGQKGRVVDHSLLAHTRPRGRARRLVRGNLAAGPVPLARTAATPGPACRGFNDHPLYAQVDRRRAGRHARRTEAAFDPRRPARCAPPVHRHVERRRVRERRPRRRLETAQRRLPRRLPARPASRIRPRSALHAHAPAGARHPVPAEPLRHLSHGPPGRDAGCGSATACRRRSATSAFRSCCIRATRTPSGCFRWTAPRCGRVPARAASPRSM